jgi:putative protease
VYLACREKFSAGDRLFKVGTKSKPVSSIWKKIRGEVPSGIRFKADFTLRQKILDDLEKPSAARTNQSESIILKVGSADEVVSALRSAAAMVLIKAGKKNLERIAKQRFSPAQIRKLGFSLPAVISEKDVDYFRAAARWFINKGFVLWEMNNWGHFDLIGEGRGLRLIAGSKLNLRNSAAIAQAAELGCSWSVPSIEITKEELRELARQRTGARLILTVYCWPPLFTSPLVPDVHEDRPFVSARNEAYQPIKTAGGVEIYADRPVSLIEQLKVLRSFGYSNFLIDVSEGLEKRHHSIESVLRGFAASRSPANYSLFNFERRPYRAGLSSSKTD